jgi:hypothetical protein
MNGDLMGTTTPSEPTFPLKTTSVSEILDRIVKLYKDHGGLLIKAMVIIYLPVIAGLSVLIPLTLIKPEFVQSILDIWGMVVTPLEIIAIIAAPAVVAKFVSDALLGNQLDLWEGINFIAGKWKALFSSITAYAICLATTVAAGWSIAMLFKYITTASGMGFSYVGFIIVGGIFLVAGLTIPAILYFTTIVAVLEDKSWFSAPKRSVQLATRSIGATVRLVVINFAAFAGFAIGLQKFSIMISAIGGWAIASAAALVGLPMNLPVIQSLLIMVSPLIAKILLSPAFAAIPALLYYDHKVRYENFSLEELRVRAKEHP